MGRGSAGLMTLAATAWAGETMDAITGCDALLVGATSE